VPICPPKKQSSAPFAWRAREAMVDMIPAGWVASPARLQAPLSNDELGGSHFAHSQDGPLQPVPSVWTTMRLLGSWHWASAGQHYQASRAREQVRSTQGRVVGRRSRSLAR